MESTTDARERRSDGAAIALIVQPTPYKWHGHFPYEGADKDSRLLVDSVARRLLDEGFAPEQIVEIVMNGDGRAYDFPRGISWSEFPVVQKPAFDYGICHGYFFERDEDTGVVRGSLHTRFGKRAKHLLPNVSRLVVVDEDFDDRILWEAISPVWASASVKPKIALATTSSFLEMGADRADALELKYRGHDRFMFNYMFNMLVIGGRARIKAAKKGDRPWNAWNGRHLYHEGRAVGKMDDLAFVSPEAVNFLQEMGRVEPIPMTEVPDEYELTPFRDKLTSMPNFSMSGPDLMFHCRGSGKYAIAFVKVGGFVKASNLSTDPTKAGEHHYTTFKLDRRRSCDDPVVNARALFHGGYIASFNGRTRLTAQGREMIDLLGPEIDDADILLRWRTPDGRICTETDIPQADRWIQRKFRALKRRVARLPASPFGEPDVTLPTRPEFRSVIRGSYADITSFPIEQRFEICARIEALQNGVPANECRAGIVYDRMAMSPFDCPLGVWVGLPLTSIKLDQEMAWNEYANMDTRDSDAEVRKILQSLPDWMEALSFGPARFLTSPTQSPLKRIIVPQMISTSGLGDHPRIGYLVYGKAVRLHEGLSSWIRQGRLRALGLGMRDRHDGDEFRTSGFWRFGFRFSDPTGIIFGNVVGVCGFSLEERKRRIPLPFRIDPSLMNLPPLPEINDQAFVEEIARTAPRIWCMDSPRNGRVLRPVDYDPINETLMISFRNSSPPAIPSLDAPILPPVRS